MNVHLFSFIRNETYLLRRWIPYHASITSLEKIHIIDHKSDDRACISLLEEFKNQGLNVERTSKSFTLKYKLLTQLMHKYKTEADILIPLDADEFLCLAEDDGTMSVYPHLVRQQLESLPLNGKKFALNVYESVLDQLDYEDPLTQIKMFKLYKASETADGPNQQTKTFFPAKNFSYTDQGNHLGGVLLAPNDIYNTSKMAIAHFHLRGFSHFMEKLEKAIDAYQLKNLPKNYVGTGMRWNEWYHQTKNLNHVEKKTWFRKNFVEKNRGENQPAMSERLKSLN